jgi:uncharacterized membrane protein SirB2
MATVKLIHVACAYLTGAGFLLRGILALLDHSTLQSRVVKTVPHVIDSILLACALLMLHQWSLSLADNAWLIAKILALLVYIGFGLQMLKWGRTRKTKLFGLIGGLATYLYIIGVAHTKSATLGL